MSAALDLAKKIDFMATTLANDLMSGMLILPKADMKAIVLRAVMRKLTAKLIELERSPPPAPAARNRVDG